MSKQIVKDEHTKNVFEKMPVTKALFTMAVPTVVGQLIVLIYSIADTFFIGQTNNPNMVAAVSLLLPIYNLTIPLANLTGVGGGTLMSMLIAKDDGKEARKVSSISFYICLLVAAVYAFIFLIFISPILYGLGANSDTYSYARSYTFLVIILGVVPISLSNTMANLVRSCGFSKEAGIGVTLGGVLNIILDPLFMFVIFEKGYEVEGAAFATLLSNVVTLIYFFIVSNSIKNKSSICYDFKIGLPRKENILMLFSLGIPASITSFFFDIDYIILDKFMSAYGAVKLAALGIVLKAERLPLNTGVGICQAMIPMVAYNKVIKNYKRMNNIIKQSLIAGILVAFISLMFYQGFTKEIIGFFIDDAETIKVGTIFLRFRTLATTFMFLSFYFNYLFQAFGEGKYCNYLCLFRWVVLNIPFLFILNHFIGMIGLVVSQFIADVITAIVSIIIYLWYNKNVLKNKPIKI